MRQTFTFADSRHKPAQALAALKNRVRKYLKRERRKSLPDGADFWDFACRVGASEDGADTAHVAEVVTRIDEVFEAGEAQVYVEILAKAGVRKTKPASDKSVASQEAAHDISVD